MWTGAKYEVRKILNAIPKQGREYRERQKKMELKEFKLIDDLIIPDHREFREFLKALITIDPKQRMSAKDALEHDF
jgi:serine/threonine protein kinase